VCVYRVSPSRLGRWLLFGLSLAEIGARELVAIGALRAVTRRARIHIERASALGRGRVDGVRAARGLKIAEPRRHTLDCGVVDGLGRDAGAERGGQIAFGQRWVVAIPVQLHAFARLLVEDGGK